MSLKKLEEKERREIIEEIEEYKKTSETKNIIFNFLSPSISILTRIPLIYKSVHHSYNPHWISPTLIPIDVEGTVLAKKIAEKYNVEFFYRKGSVNHPAYSTEISDSKEVEEKIETLSEAKENFSLA